MPECKEALDMAIKALEQEPCDDCISRAEAIDASVKDLLSINDVSLADYVKENYIPKKYGEVKAESKVNK